MNNRSLITQFRSEFHSSLLTHILTRSVSGVPSNADKNSKPSVAIASSIYAQLGGTGSAQKLAGQTSGTKFEEICTAYIDKCFSKMEHIRPGKFSVVKGGAIAQFDQYSHLNESKAKFVKCKMINTIYVASPQCEGCNASWHGFTRNNSNMW